jgi:hypothetical protein
LEIFIGGGLGWGMSACGFKATGWNDAACRLSARPRQLMLRTAKKMLFSLGLLDPLQVSVQRDLQVFARLDSVRLSNSAT